ncbi:MULTISPECIES: MFS transporter [unclassified Paenibacillus]|uniref:MFS transporter n=1 Tax=unclassified Paenibacillus TaxID=185978 RepID=UPI001AE18AF9|nr:MULTISPECIES: MFS transporter [unclassified Paenibacillus]MBP1156815.1 YQGE family putative transporter [Paenibacillus sp. PvP091]MBP1172446.1 YQGE family putative transporter [Paenibacillus sp. PvR098]MBP2438827.1 YQGE family putative transporter [Paenibacillus sp. PvP052]
MHTGTKHFPDHWTRGGGKGGHPHKWREREGSGGRDNEEPGNSKNAPLTGQSRLLLAVNGLFAAANALSGIFVNVYLWKAKHDFAVIGWFTLMHHLTMAMTFWLAGKWVKEHNKMNCLRTGVAVAALFYLLVLWFGERAADYFLLLGAVQGLSSGLFWLAFNVIYFEVTDPDNRDRFNGAAGLLGSGAGMIAPWISGFLIVRMQEYNGYRLIFTLSLIVFCVGVFVSFFLKKRKTSGRYEWFLTWRCLRQKDTVWRKVGLALMAQGIREGVFVFMITLLVYVHTGSEMKLGNFSLLTSAAALISFMIAGRLLRPEYRPKAILIGAVMLVLIILPFFWKVNFATLLVFGIGAAIFYPLYGIPMTSIVFDLIGGDNESVKRREEYIVMRELALNAGRLLGTAVFIIVVSLTRSPAAMNWLLLAIGSSPIAASYWIRKAQEAKV